ncbi:unnamed protein product [Phaedon cochleariae]|uniref:Uncharacterized protein n=1 Tax=Phaedon cochleariae TaxID=80249 RepID=A0A9N9SJZ9_PHACE|nr:unnamed protein product [Phaedon cochleariae]
MVECTKCIKWYCFECVNVTEAVALDEYWMCPSCEAIHQETMAQQSDIQFTPHQSLNQLGVIPTSLEPNKSLTITIAQSLKSKHSGSTTSSRRKLKLQILQEEIALIRKERELAEQTRKLLDEESDDSQCLDKEYLERSEPLANRLLSLQIENGVQ